jgi:predicted nucleic acid-binding protein
MEEDSSTTPTMRMSGKLVDLSHPEAEIPDLIAIDTNVVIAYLQQTFPRQDPQQIARATAFFANVHANDLTCVVTPTVFSEIVHAAVKEAYRQLIPGNRAALREQHGVPINSWMDLIKVDPTPLQGLRQNLTMIRHALIGNDITVAGQEDLDFVAYPPQHHFSDELIDRMVRYGMDSSDAVITMEASRLGIGAIVSMDRDMQRALPDFDIYSWL